MCKRLCLLYLTIALVSEQETELYQHLREQEKMLQDITGVANLI